MPSFGTNSTRDRSRQQTSPPPSTERPSIAIPARNRGILCDHPIDHQITRSSDLHIDHEITSSPDHQIRLFSYTGSDGGSAFAVHQTT
jgi:hypothetical protein